MDTFVLRIAAQGPRGRRVAYGDRCPVSRFGKRGRASHGSPAGHSRTGRGGDARKKIEKEGMNIGFDAKRLYNNRSGLGNYSRTLVGQLAGEHPDDRYLLYTPKVGIEVDFASAPNVRTVLPGGLWRAGGSLWRTYAVAGAARREGLDIFHGLSHELPVGIERTGVRSVVTIHDLIFMRHPEYFPAVDRWIYGRKVRYATRVADAIVAISRQTRQDLIDLLGVPEEKIHVVYQSVAPAYRPGADACGADGRDDRLEGLGLPPDFILCVGTIEARKNQMALAAALQALPREVHLVLVGRRSGSYGKRLDDFLTRSGLSDRVHFLPGVSSARLAALYRRCRFVAYPSFYEGFGLPIVEALGSGKAVLTSQGGCFSEAGGPGALYVSPHDVQAVAEAMRTLWDDASLRSRLAGEGAAYIRRFSDAGTSQRMYDLYRKLAER